MNLVRILKSIRMALALFIGIIAQGNEASDPNARLSGLLTTRGTAKAFFILREPGIRQTTRIMLGEHEKNHGVEVETIDLSNGSVTVRIDGAEKNLTLDPVEMETAKISDSPSGHRGDSRDSFLALHDMPLEQALDVYAFLTERTLLRPALFRDATFRLKTPTRLSSSTVAQILETALANRGVSLLPDGNKFAVAVPTEIEEHLQGILPTKPVVDGNNAVANDAVVLKVENMPRSQFLELYGMISGRTVVKRDSLPSFGLPSTITLKIQQALSKAETIYACEAVLALNGIKVVPLSKNEVKIEPIRVRDE